MLLIGSRALSYWLGKDLTKESSDWDIIGLRKDINPCLEKIEWHSPFTLNNHEALKLYGSGEMVVLTGGAVEIMSLKGLALLYRSHAFRSRKFRRNMHLLKQCGWPNVELGEDDREFLKKRIKLTKEEYGDRVPSLNQSNEDFFDDKVEKHFEHDWIHEQMAHYDAPLYTRMKHDQSLAKCEKDLWICFSHEDKIKCVLEECYVIGLERFIVPRKLAGERHPPAPIAAEWALEKVCTTLCSGWFRDFAIDNHQEILESIDRSKIDTFIEKHLTGEKCEQSV